MALKHPLESLDPTMAVDETSGIVLSMVHRFLFKPMPDGSIVPDLVKTETLQGNRLILDLHLNNELTAIDAAFSLNRLIESGRQTWVVSGIEKVTVQGPYTLELQLKKNKNQNALYLDQRARLSLPQCVVYSKEKYIADRSFSQNGEFKLISNSLDEIRLLEKKTQGVLSIPLIRDGTSRWFFFRRAMLDVYEAEGIFRELPFDEDTYLRRDVPQLIVLYAAIVTSENSVTVDIKFRQYLNYRLDRSNLTAKVLLGAYQPADYPVPPALAEPVERFYDYRPQLSYRVHEKNKNETLTVYSPPDRERQSVARVIAQLVRETGLNAVVQVYDLSALLQFNNQKKPGIYVLKWVADYPSPMNFLQPLFHSGSAGSAGNRSWYKDKKLDRLIEQAAVSKQSLKQAQQRIQEQAPWVFIGFSRKRFFIKKGSGISIPMTYSAYNPEILGFTKK